MESARGEVRLCGAAYAAPAGGRAAASRGDARRAGRDTVLSPTLLADF